MFKELTDIFNKPQQYKHANSTELWNNPHISTEMLKCHLDPNINAASRTKDFMDKMKRSRSTEEIWGGDDTSNDKTPDDKPDLGSGPAKDI